MSFFCCSVKGASINNVIPILYGQIKEFLGNSHARITWTKEECSFNPGLRYSPVDTCAYLFYFFSLFFIFLIFCLTRMARTMTRMACMARTMTRVARTMTRMARWLAC